MHRKRNNEIEQLYAEQRVALLRLAYRYTNNWDVASDVVQTAMLKFLRRFEHIAHIGHENHIRYLFTVVRHCAIQEANRQKRVVPMEDTLLADKLSQNAEDAALANLTLDEIRACIDQLKPQYGDYLRMRYVDDLDDAVIADFLCVKESSLRMIAVRAKRALRQAFEKKGTEVKNGHDK